MSIGTPYLVCAGTANNTVSSYATTVTTTTNQGDAIAVWVTSNTSTNNISTNAVTDSQSNVYAPGPQGPVSGTNLNGEWFVCNNANKLTAGSDTITVTHTGTGGSKTMQAVGGPGVIAGTPFDQSNEASGNNTTPTTTTPITTQNNELILAGELNASGGGAIAWTGDFTTPTLSNSQHPGSAQFAAIAAKVLTATQTVTGSGTITTNNWAISVLTLLPAVTNTSVCRVGTTVPNLALGNTCPTNPGETPYDSGLSQVAGDDRFIAAVNRSFFGHLAVSKKFWTQVNDYRTGLNDIANYAAFGTFILFALTPPLSGGTAADKTALANFLTAMKNLGFNPSNCAVTLWQEPEGSTHFGSGGFNQYQTQLQIFGPVVNASGLPHVMDIGMGGGVTTATNFLNAGYAAAGVTFQAQYHDYYYSPWSRGILLTEVAAIADAHNLPIGLGEFGSHATDNNTGYMNYITGFFQTRQQQGKKVANVIRYEGQCSTLGTGDLTSPILNATDPRVGLYQTMFDTLTTIPTNNIITVTSPGNQTNNISDNVHLQITATDSDPSQTLTFSATGLPAGLAISPTGLITGSPTTQQVSNVTVTATDTSGSNGSAGFTWTINPVVTNTITVANPGNQSTQLGAVVNLAITATDSNVGITTFTWGASGLPTGLVIAPGPASTGVITGAPTALGTFTVSVTATDVTGSSGNTTFTWVITNPQTLPAGKFQTIQPVNPSPLGGLGVCDELSYELSFGITAGPSSTIPFCAVTLNFYDFDEPAGIQNFVSQVTYRVPMGTISDPNGPAVVYGRGPLRGQFMRVQFHNVDTVDATLEFLQIVGTSRAVDRDDWRWDAGGNSPVIPGFINATAATGSLVLGGLSNVNIPASGSITRLCSMYAGQAYMRARLNLAGASSVTLTVNPQPASLFSSQAIWNQTLTPGNEQTSPPGFALPRGPVAITINNNDNTNVASVNVELIAIET